MRFGNIKIFMMALLTIAKTERPTPKNLKILKNKLYFCFKYQSKLRKIAYNIYPAIQQVKLKKNFFNIGLPFILRIARSTHFQSIEERILSMIDSIAIL